MNDSLARRRRRLQFIRGRVVAGAIALFVAVFGGITAGLASGHDPVLAKQSTTATQPQQQDTSLAPVTTRQS